MKEGNSRLWIYFVLIVFAIMLASAIVMVFLALLMFHFGQFTVEEGNPFVPFCFLLFISVLIGTSISIFVAKKILNPIARFSKAAAEVAKGNFDIHLDEAGRIAEIRELTHNFNLMAKELSNIETLRNDFVVNVSHEFKTPIAAIEGYATLLQDWSLSAAQRDEYTRMIIDSARSLSALAENILLLSKLENHDDFFERNPFRLDEQIRQAVLMLEPEWSRKELDLQIDLAKMSYCGNEPLLWQVWVNVIGNAVKFTPKDGQIGIRLFPVGANIVVRISDTGCGIADDTRRHIFDKFYQGDTTRKSDGNGLGLALVKRIIDLCGGRITVASEIEKGSTFTITLPIES
jgi:signal transduction histidine kinase